jgi:hypothetical protein
MSSNKKHSSLGLTLAISLGMAFSAGVVHAGNIGDTYTAGDTLTAAKMDTIKAAVNDNDAKLNGTTNSTLKTAIDDNTADITALDGRVTANEGDIADLQTDVTNLQNGTPTCGAGTTAVGPICVDNTPAAGGATWIAAVNACRDLGKRLLTPGEYMAAKSLGTVPDMDINGQFEWVDSVSASGSSDSDPVGGLAGRLIVAFMGPGLSPTHVPVAGAIFFSTTATYDTTAQAWIVYRCAR